MSNLPYDQRHSPSVEQEVVPDDFVIVEMKYSVAGLCESCALPYEDRIVVVDVRDTTVNPTSGKTTHTKETYRYCMKCFQKVLQSLRMKRTTDGDIKSA